MINNTTIVMAVILCLGLTGCTAMNDNYDCPLKNGASCLSLQDMDRNLTVELQNGETAIIDKTSSGSAAKETKPVFNAKRSKDLTAKIWLAPYEDVDGNYHAASYIHTVVEQAAWSVR